MTRTTNPGIDYGHGMANVDAETGIRFGIIPANEVLQVWADGSEPDYGDPRCPECEVETDEDYYCTRCDKHWEVEDCLPDEPTAWSYDADGYQISQGGDDSDLFILRSPYYTHAQFCSPCAPGAGYLLNHCPDGPKTYCLGHDWWETGKAPYPVYSVATGELVRFRV